MKRFLKILIVLVPMTLIPQLLSMHINRLREDPSLIAWLVFSLYFLGTTLPGGGLLL